MTLESIWKREENRHKQKFEAKSNVPRGMTLVTPPKPQIVKPHVEETNGKEILDAKITKILWYQENMAEDLKAIKMFLVKFGFKYEQTKEDAKAMEKHRRNARDEARRRLGIPESRWKKP